MTTPEQPPPKDDPADERAQDEALDDLTSDLPASLSAAVTKRDVFRGRLSAWLCVTGYLLLTLGVGSVGYFAAFPPKWMTDAFASPSTALIVVGSRGAAGIVVIGVGFAMVRLGLRVGVPLVLEQRRKASDADDLPLGTAVSKLIDVAADMFRSKLQ